MVDGAKIWINCQRLAILSTFSRWQLIQNSMLSNIVLRQCDIQIGIVVNKLYIYCKETYKKLIFPGVAEI